MGILPKTSKAFIDKLDKKMDKEFNEIFDKDKDKELYKTHLIQSMLERITELEDKVARLEQR